MVRLLESLLLPCLLLFLSSSSCIITQYHMSGACAVIIPQSLLYCPAGALCRIFSLPGMHA